MRRDDLDKHPPTDGEDIYDTSWRHTATVLMTPQISLRDKREMRNSLNDQGVNVPLTRLTRYPEGSGGQDTKPDDNGLTICADAVVQGASHARNNADIIA